mgnify:FL=1
MEKLDLYYDHYKETYALSKQAQTRRNKLFVLLCVFEALSFLVLIKPNEALEAFSSGINAYFETDIIFGNVVLQTFLWIIIAYTTVRYCQDTLYVERLYPYLDKLEKEISALSESKIFEREGSGYLNNYPMVLNFVDLFYKVFCPILFVGINTIHILQEWSGCMSLALICDTAIFASILIITWFYFFEIHSKITAWCKTHIPVVNRMAEALRRILKEV